MKRKVKANGCVVSLSNLINNKLPFSKTKFDNVISCQIHSLPKYGGIFSQEECGGCRKFVQVRVGVTVEYCGCPDSFRKESGLQSLLTQLSFTGVC